MVLSSPLKNPCCHMYVYYDKQGLKFSRSFETKAEVAYWLNQIQEFCDQFEVKKHINRFTHYREVTLKIIYNKVTLYIKSDWLEEALDWSYKGFEPNLDYRGSFSHSHIISPKWFIDPNLKAEVEPEKKLRGDISKTPKKAPVSKPKRKSAPQNAVTITQIAKDNDLTPAKCRQALRKSKTQKPDYGWSFLPKDIPSILKTIKKYYK